MGTTDLCLVPSLGQPAPQGIAVVQPFPRPARIFLQREETGASPSLLSPLEHQDPPRPPSPQADQGSVFHGAGGAQDLAAVHIHLGSTPATPHSSRQNHLATLHTSSSWGTPRYPVGSPSSLRRSGAEARFHPGVSGKSMYCV